MTRKALLFSIVLLLIFGISTLIAGTPRQKDAMVKVAALQGGQVATGRGFIFSPDGLVFTAAHLVENSNTQFRVMVGGKTERADLIMLDGEREVEVATRARLAVLLDGLGVEHLLARVALAPDAIGHLPLALLDRRAWGLLSPEPAHGPVSAALGVSI